MSRASMMPARNLTLMEELEKLEQSITLTLQEIDHNFSRAHRIVTTSILPVIEQYAKHSNAVWQGSEFWKGFFEASANVKLSSYEEPVEGEETLEDATTKTLQEHEYGTPSTRAGGDDDTTSTMEERPTSRYQPGAQDLSSPAGGTGEALDPQATPRRERQGAEEASFAEYPSPYETLKREMTSDRPNTNTNTNAKPTNPTTPGFPKLHPSQHGAAANDSFDSSPFIPLTTTRRVPLSTAAATTAAPANADPLLHRVLDKNYRIQATPLTSHRTAARPQNTNNTTDQTTTSGTNNLHTLDFSSPFSPPTAAPQLRAEIFGSPIARAVAAPRTPGVSVQKSAGMARKSRIPTPKQTRGGLRGDDQRHTANLFTPGHDRATTPRSGYQTKANVWDSDSDRDDEDEGDTQGFMAASPPKTLQFHIPASRLVRTPAREASRRIVEGLVGEAGGDSGRGEGGDDGREVGDVGVEGGNEAWEDDDEIDVDLDLDLDMSLGSSEGDGARRDAGDDDSPSVVRVARRDADADAF